MRIALERLRPDSAPVRHSPTPADDDALLASMQDTGQLVPLLVVRLGDDLDDDPDYEVKDGNRRLAAAKAIGLPHLEAHVLERTRTDYTLAVATAANLVRAPLAAVDLWRALQQLLAKGFALSEAAATLGLSDRRAVQLSRLGQMHPDLLALIERSHLPADSHLRVLANAPHDVQKRAIATKGGVLALKDHTAVDWAVISEACRRQRISRDVAAFDLATAGVAFERDFFAQPGDADEWTTGDVVGFLKAQRRALQDQVAASKGRMRMVEESTREPGLPSLPTGWRASQGKADKPTKRETVFACVASRTGAIVRITAVDAKAERERERQAAERQAAKAPAAAAEPSPAPAPAATTPAPTPAPLPSAIGTVATPIGASTPAPADAEDDPAEDPPAPGAGQAAAEAAREHLTKGGLTALADLKTAGLRARLRDSNAPLTTGDLLALMVLAIHAANVRVDHYGGPTGWDAHKGRDLVARLVGHDGHLRYSEPELQTVARETLARVLSFDRPAHGYSPYNNRSGATAEWVAAALIIDHGTHLPRLDTADLLAGCEASVLKEAAAAAGIKYTTAAAAKRELVGKLEHWRPAFAHFGAPGPRPAKVAP